MKIWLDDVRQAPDGYIHFKTAEELIVFLRKNFQNTIFLSLDLDHDLGEKCLSGLDVLNWIDERSFLDTAYVPPKIDVHTDNAAVYIKMKNISNKLNELRENRIFYLGLYGS